MSKIDRLYNKFIFSFEQEKTISVGRISCQYLFFDCPFFRRYSMFVANLDRYIEQDLDRIKTPEKKK